MVDLMDISLLILFSTLAFSMVYIFAEQVTDSLEDKLVLALFFFCFLIVFLGIPSDGVLFRLIVSLIAALGITWFSLLESRFVRKMRQRDIAIGVDRLKRAMVGLNNEKAIILRFEAEPQFRIVLAILMTTILLVDIFAILYVVFGNELSFSSNAEKLASYSVFLFGLPFLILLHQTFPVIGLKDNGIVINHFFYKKSYAWEEIGEAIKIYLPSGAWFLVIDSLPVIYLVYGLAHLRKPKRGIILHPKLVGLEELLSKIDSFK